MGVRNIRVPRRLKGTWALAFLVGTLSLQAHAENADSPTETTPSEASARSGDSDGYECAMEEAEAQPRNATEWLERGLWASHCYAFQARAVAIDSVDVRTLALSHRIKDGIRQQVVQYLDGPPRLAAAGRCHPGYSEWFYGLQLRYALPPRLTVRHS